MLEAEQFYIQIYSANTLTPNDDYSGRTAPLTSKRCILYIYSTNRGTEYFRHCIYSPFFSSSKCSLFHKSNIFGSSFIHILYRGCAKIKKNNSDAKALIINLSPNNVREKATRSTNLYTTFNCVMLARGLYLSVDSPCFPNHGTVQTLIK